MFTLKRIVLLIAICSLILSFSAKAQVNPTLERGLKPYGSYSGGDIDQVSLVNGSLGFEIPLWSSLQRGQLEYSVFLRYENATLQKDTDCNTPTHRCIYTWSYIKQPSVTARDTTYISLSPAGVYNNNILLGTKWSIETADGSTHNLGYTTAGLESLDASGLKYDKTNGIITDRKGTQYFVGSNYGNPTKVRDRNGNYLSATSTTAPWADSLGRSIPRPNQLTVTTTDYSGCTGPYPIVSAKLWTVPGYNGGSLTFKFCYVALSAKTNYFLSDDQYHQEAQIYNSSGWLQSVVLPDSSGAPRGNSKAWTFEYDAVPAGQAADGHIGDLLKITFPTGGSLQYSGWRDEHPCMDNNTVTRSLRYRTIDASDGTGQHTWDYAGMTIDSRRTVTDPQGNQTVYIFAVPSTTCGSYETKTQYFQNVSGTQVLLKTVDTDYLWEGNPYDRYTGTTSPINVVPIRTTTTWPTGQIAKTEKTFDTSSFTWDMFAAGTTYSGRYGLTLSQSDFDWGSGAAGSKLRQIDNTYLALNNANYKIANILDPITQTTIKNGGGTQVAQTTFAYDESGRLVSSGITAHRDSVTYRANQTSMSRWRNLPSVAWLTTQNYFYDTGMPQKTLDPLSHGTQFFFDSAYAGGYLTQVLNAKNQATNKTYDVNTGALASETDANNQSTSYSYYADGRLQQVTNPPSAGGQTAYSYQDGPSTFGVTAVTQIQSNIQRTDSALVDGLARAKQTTMSDPEGADIVDISYDARGMTALVSNPHRASSESTDGTTTTQYDAVGRITSVLEPGGDAISYTYSGNCTTVTDEAGKKRKMCTDGLNRLVQVFEPDAWGAWLFETNYQFDALGNLTRVDQKGNDANSGNWRTRLFSYDSLSRLLSSTNPESGTISYSYDNDSRLLTKMDARGITTTYGYDELHRINSKTYSNGDPAVGFTYDANTSCPAGYQNGVGHRTSMTDAAGGASWCYDSTGRVRSELRTINSITREIDYEYNLDSSLKSIDYAYDPNSGSRRKFTYAPTSAGRTAAASDASTTYAQDASYSPNGALKGVKYGGSNGIVIANTYNSRMQPVTLSATAQSQTLLSLTYNFGLGSNDNGNVYGITNNLDGVQPNRPNGSAVFTYDHLNRLTSAHTLATDCTVVAGGLTKNWGQNFTIDAWGNLYGVSVERCSVPTLTAGVDPFSNRLVGSGYTYDAAGNMLSDGWNAFTYDAESRIAWSAGVTYTYDGDGKRVKKSSGKLYWTATGSDPLTETDLGGTPTADYVFFNGKRAGRVDLPAGTVHYYFSDHLGSASVVANADGTVIHDESDYYPFGGERVITSSDPNSYKFTGKERDAETGLDNFGARYFGSNMGRFLSPDEPFLDQEEGNPQSWNLYSYVRNNPLNSVDPDGNAHSECKNDENGQEVCYIVGDKNGELINNGTLQWNAKKQEWEKPEEHTYNDEERIQFIANGVSELTRFHSLWEVGTNALPYAMGGYAAARITMAAPGLTTLGLSNPSEETVVIGKMADLQQLKPGERQLDLPNQGSPKANWIQNSSRLRQAMNEGNPIRDASAGNPGSNTGFLRAERNLLQSHGWTLKGEYWVPPGK